MMRSLVRSLVFVLAAAVAPVVLGACSKKPPEITAENMDEQGAVTEQHEAGSVSVLAAPDGRVKLLLRDARGKPVETDVSGTVSAKEPDKQGVIVDLKAEPKGGMLAATVPPFQADVTELQYDLKVGSTPLQGVLHVPHGGTKALRESAKANANPTLEGKAGPNGGILQVVGDDTLEIVADKDSGEVRAYVLDKDLKPAAIGDREVKLALTTPKGPEIVVLTPGPDRVYFTGKLVTRVNPTKITVVVTDGGRTDVVLCRYRPGAVIVVGPKAPAINILVVTNWVVVKPAVVVQGGGDRVIVVHKGKGKGKGQVKIMFKKH